MNRLPSTPDRPDSTGRRAGLAALLAFGVVGFQHVLHATVFGPPASLGTHMTHWGRDGALAFGVALLAVHAGLLLAARAERGGRGAERARLLPRAAAVALVFAVLTVPSALVHDALDGSGHGGGDGNGHGRGPLVPAEGLEHAADLGGMLLHGLRDALVGQVAALPLIAAGLAAFGLAARPAAGGAGRRRPGLRPAADFAARPAAGAGRRRPRLRPAAALVTAGSMASAMLVAAPTAVRPVAAAIPDPCTSGAPQRVYDVSAVNVRITLNRFGDNDPGGYMYVLDQDIARVRAEEAARQVSTGLRKDAIQPLVLRANLGECLVVRFTNRLTTGPDGDEGRGGPAPKVSFHVNGLGFAADQQGGAVGRNPDTMVPPGGTRTYRIAVNGDEGIHAVNSLGDSRALTAHGLFGAVIAEPPGSVYRDPETGAVSDGTKWEAIIDPASGPSFREFAIIYHEIGNERFDVRDRNGDALPTFDDLTNTYRPGSRALNYRSEPHMRRVELGSDESQAYGSYAFGDPATPTPRSYLGEPSKTRLLHAGGEMSHVHHLHGGGTRWRRSPAADANNRIDSGLSKTVERATSVRLDSQITEPGEGYSLEHECGAGGCQQAAGDFLYHCHIAHHYVGGMWAFWRVFDTLQPDLATIPGRAPAPVAVPSDQLIGTVIEGKTIVAAAALSDPATQRSLEDLVESQLPPQGVRLDDEDATVWDWAKGGTPAAPVYLGEPEDTRVWANFASPTPGQRPVIMFNPTNGRYAWPLLRPHLAKRPPFSPNGHGGAPWLGETGSTSRPDGICPAGSFVRPYDVTAITLPIQQTASGKKDDDGQIFVLNEDRAAVLAGRKRPEPLAIRANGGEAGKYDKLGDCVALTFTSDLRDNDENRNHSKVNMHIHFVQFDPQASDGVISGMSYEQSVRPFKTENRVLVADAPAGAATVRVSHTDRLRPGISVAVGQGEPGIEIRTIRAIDPDSGLLTLDRPLDRAHAAGQSTGVEFTQYRWFADVDAGTVFWHDHVAGSTSWDHGLFGALIIEPPGSTYHDPRTGEEVRSGAIVDIRTNGMVADGVKGSFREFMVWVHNDARARGNDGDGRGSINLLAEPLDERDGAGDPYAFSSVKHGDPFTPLPRAYVGDNFVFRVLGLAEKEASLRVLGHRFRQERFDPNGRLEDAMTLGISERSDWVVDGGAGGPGRKAGDYLYYSAVQREWEDGAWGILRVHDTRQPDLQPLPSSPAPPTGSGFPHLTRTGANPPAATDPGDACPPAATVRRFRVSIFRATLPFPSPDSNGIVYALDDDVAAIQAGTKPVTPLVVRANVGECIDMVLTNRLDRRASMAFGGVLLDPQGSAGSAIGFNPDTTVAPGESRTYRVHADKDVGVVPFLNLADVTSLAHGAYGGLVIEPAGAFWTDPVTGGRSVNGVVADITTPNGSFRELVTFFHDDDEEIGRSRMPYPRAVDGTVGINYRAAPFTGRGAEDPDSGGFEAPGASVFSSLVNGDPPTTLLRAYAGDPVKIRAVMPAGEQFHGFWVDGHQWPIDPQIPGSDRVSVRTLGPGQGHDAFLVGGAGGPSAKPGDYVYGDARMPYQEAGVWGLLRVFGSRQGDLVPLGTAPRPPSPTVAVSPASVDFGAVPVGETSDARVVSVTNTSDLTLEVGTPFVEGAGAARFDLTGATGRSCRGASVDPGESCTIGVRFSPVAGGPVTATLRVPTNATGSPHAVPLTGGGAAPSGLRVTPPAIAFADQTAGTQSATTFVTVENVGAVNVTVRPLSMVGLHPGSFSISWPETTCAGANLAPTRSCVVGVRFTPVAGGFREASLQIGSTDPAAPHLVALSGKGTAPTTGGPAIGRSTTLLQFGDVKVGATSPVKRVVISNIGGQPLEIGRVRLGGISPRHYVVPATTCTPGRILPPGGACTVDVRFAPKSTGLKKADLVIESPNAIDRRVALRGTGAG